MENEILIALLTKMVDDRISQLPVLPGHRGPRGQSGVPGKDGTGFIFSEHEETIRQWAKDAAIKFQDFSEEQIHALRGPRGRDGNDGRDGQDFIFSEHEEAIRQWAKDFSLKFQDLTPEQIDSLKGKDGKDGASFSFDVDGNRIESLIRGAVHEIRDELKLRFSDLDADDIRELRGPRGRDGHDGRDFIFEEHREFFDSLRLRFSDLTAEEKESLKLHFSQLSDEEKSSLKLRFKDLTEDDLALIRGPRGSRGQKGIPGRDGIQGRDGVRGLPGAQGILGLTGARGIDGLDGTNGLDGQDAPHVVAIDIEQVDNDIVFVFEFSDGSVIKSDRVSLPAAELIAGGGGVRGKRNVSHETHIDEVSDTITYVGKSFPGSETNVATWQIQRILIDGTETIIEWADGDSKFDNIWDDREDLEYN